MTENLELPQEDKNYWVKAMEAVMLLHLKLERRMRGVSLAYVVRQHVKMSYISLG